MMSCDYDTQQDKDIFTSLVINNFARILICYFTIRKADGFDMYA